MQRPAATALLASLALSVGVLSPGCAQRAAIPSRAHGFTMGSAGHASEVVFHGPLLAGAEDAAGDETYRRDHTLAAAAPTSLFDAHAWPDDHVPALDDAQRLYTPRQPNAHLYFNSYRYRAYRDQFQFGY